MEELETLYASPPDDDDDDDDGDADGERHSHDHDHDDRDRDRDRDDDDRPPHGAFASASNTATMGVALGGDVTFNAIGPRRHLTPPGVGGTDFIIHRSGDYNYSYEINGRQAVAQPMVFELTRNGNSVAGTRFASGTPTGGNDTVNGAGTAFLVRGDVVTLRNVITSPGGPILLDSTVIGGANNASLSLTRVNFRRS